LQADNKLPPPLAQKPGKTKKAAKKGRRLRKSNQTFKFREQRRSEEVVCQSQNGNRSVISGQGKRNTTLLIGRGATIRKQFEEDITEVRRPDGTNKG